MEVAESQNGGVLLRTEEGAMMTSASGGAMATAAAGHGNDGDDIPHTWAVSASTDGVRKRVNEECNTDHGRFVVLDKLGTGAFAQIW